MNDSHPLAPWEGLHPRQPRAVKASTHAAAFVIDVAVAGVLTIFVAIVYASTESGLPARLRFVERLVGSILWALVVLVSMTEIFWATSPGKWLASITIRTAAGAPASRRRLALRWAVKYSPLLFISAEATLPLLVSLFNWGAYPPLIAGILTFAESVAGIAFWSVILGGLLAIFPSHRTLVDWIAGTAVFFNSELEHDAMARGFEVQVASAANPPDQL
jgi:hypothetical protein